MSQHTLSEPLEFKNERVLAFATLQPACRIELKVHASPDLTELARSAAVKAVGKDVELPGFRKGRAPDEMIRKRFPHEIEKALHNKLADLAFAEVQKIAKIPVLNHNSTVTFDLKSLSESGADLLFHFETEPQIPTIDPKQFHPKPVPRSEVTEQQIEEAIRQMQFFFAQWTPVADRPIQDKDIVVIDLDTIDGDQPQRVFNQVRFEVSPDKMAEWMHSLVIGAKAGDVLEGFSQPDAGATEQEKEEFQPKKIRISILEVNEALLPELNDDLAKKVGSENLAAMRQSITEMLNRQLDTHVLQQMREQVNEFLIEHYPFEVPHSLVKTEKDHRHQQLAQNAKFKSDWAKMSHDERVSFEEKLTIESNHSVRIFYLSRQIINDAKINISHKEVQEEAVAILKAQGTHDNSIDQIPKEIYALAISKVMLAKAQDFILREQKA